MTKRIYVFSPSSAVRDKAAVRRGAARLRALGHAVEFDEAAFATRMRFAGDDEVRLAAIGRAAASGADIVLITRMRFAGDDDVRLAAIARAAASGADIVLITRGGYGLSRLLPRIPYQAVAKAIDRGTQFVGLSDFTAFQSAVLSETGRMTWAGPALGEDFGVEDEPDDIMQACFEDLVAGQGEGTGWRVPKTEAREAPFEAKGMLWGGNLAMIASLVGTPWLPKVKGGILFLEDVGEHPYRIERMLTQLHYAGVLGRQKAIVLGQFTNWQPFAHDKGYKLQTVVEWLRQAAGVPVFTGLPFGHVRTKVCLPVGAKVNLLVEGRDAFLLWGHLHTTRGHVH